jgi:hypothetical protein
MSIFSSQPRRANGEYDRKDRRKGSWGKRIVGIFIIGVGVYFAFGHPMVMNWLDSQMVVAKSTRNTAAKAFVAEASENVAVKTADEIREEMIGKIWGGESQKYQPEEGEVWMIYDPPRALRESGKCQQGGRALPWECFSFGPMQWKIETLQGFHKQIHGTEISEMEAMAIANDLERSQELAFECWVKVEGCIWHWTTAEAHAEYFRTVLPIVRKLMQE